MKIAIVILSVALIASNAYWVYQLIDVGVTLSYRDQQTYELDETRKQLMAMIPEVAINAKKEEIIASASKYTDEEAFEKEGCTWVGWLGLKFDGNNKLKSVSPSWSYGREDPCYPTF